MESNFTALVSFIDGFVLKGKVDLSSAKEIGKQGCLDSYNYGFFVDFGGAFFAHLYWFSENGKTRPFIDLHIHLCALESANDPMGLARQLLEDNSSFPHPIKFSVYKGEVCISGRWDIGAVELGYSKALIETIMLYSKGALSSFIEKYKVTPITKTEAAMALH